MHTYIHPLFICIHLQIHKSTSIHPCIDPFNDECIHIRTSYNDIYTLIDAHIHMLKYTYMHTYIHTYMHINRYMHMCMCMCAYVHIYIQMHTYICVLCIYKAREREREKETSVDQFDWDYI